MAAAVAAAAALDLQQRDGQTPDGRLFFMKESRIEHFFQITSLVVKFYTFEPVHVTEPVS